MKQRPIDRWGYERKTFNAVHEHARRPRTSDLTKELLALRTAPETASGEGGPGFVGPFPLAPRASLLQLSRDLGRSLAPLWGP